MWIRKVVDATIGTAGSIGTGVYAVSTPILCFGATTVVWHLPATAGTYTSATIQRCNNAIPGTAVNDPNWVDATYGTAGVDGSVATATLDLTVAGGAWAVACPYSVITVVPALWMRVKVLANASVTGASCIARAVYDTKPAASRDKGTRYQRKLLSAPGVLPVLYSENAAYDADDL